MVCFDCLPDGICRNERTALVSDKALSTPEFIRDLRSFAYGLKVSSYHWHDVLCDLYRDYPGCIINENGEEVFLDMHVFEMPTIRDWFRDFCCTPVPATITPYVRGEARERARILATILKASYPKDAMMWGVRAANDNVDRRR